MQFALKLFRRRKCLTFILFSFSTLVILSACQKHYDHEEASKMLIAADRELALTMNRLLETRAFFALSGLNKFENAPLPFRFFTSDTNSVASYFDFETHKGFYSENENGKLEWTKASDSLIIDYYFDKPSQKRAMFVLSEYRESMTAFGNQMPVLAKGYLLLNGEVIMELKHHARLEHGLPKTMDFSLRLDKIKINLLSKLSFGKDESKLRLTFTISDWHQQLLEAKVITAVNMTEEKELYFGKKSISLQMFPISFHLKSDYPFNGMPLAGFIDDFNRLSEMSIRDMDGNLLGNLSLTFMPEFDRVSLLISFPDGTQSNLEKTMKNIYKVFNIKTVYSGLPVNR